jgi:hypothetical protein
MFISPYIFCLCRFLLPSLFFVSGIVDRAESDWTNRDNPRSQHEPCGAEPRREPVRVLQGDTEPESDPITEEGAEAGRGGDGERGGGREVTDDGGDRLGVRRCSLVQQLNGKTMTPFPFPASLILIHLDHLPLPGEFLGPSLRRQSGVPPVQLPDVCALPS